MNRTYRSIWNEALGAWVAASEISTARGKPNKSAVARAVAAAVLVAGTGIEAAHAQYSAGGGYAASGTNAIAIGSASFTTAGQSPSATANGAIAIGGNATSGATLATNSNATAFGTSAQATGLASSAFGQGSSASGSFATAVGSGTKATADYATALGSTSAVNGIQTRASGVGSTAIGSNSTAGAQAAAPNSVAVGGQSNVSSAATSGIAVGRGAYVGGAYAIALGDGATTDGAGSIVIGRGASSMGGGQDINAVAIGMNAAGYSSSVALGDGASADQNTYLKQNGGVAIGPSASTSNGTTRAIALGSGATVNPSSGVIDAAMALGAGASASNNGAVAIGKAASASGADSIAQGTNAVASNASTIAIGNGAKATGSQSISIGTGNVVSGSSSGAIGDPTTITGSGSYSLGNNNTINANNAFVVGNNVSIPTGLDGAVVLGNNSTVTASTPTPSGTINGTTYNYAGGNPAAGGVVSIGAAGAERQIQNVAAGQVSATSTDAINGSQLYATNQAIASGLTSLSTSTSTSIASLSTSTSTGLSTTNSNLTSLSTATSSSISSLSTGLSTTNSNMTSLSTSTSTAIVAAKTHYYSVNDGGTQGSNYNNDGATGTNALAAGVGASASGASGVAVGAGAVASGSTNAIAIGAGAVASGNRVITIGSQAGTGSTGFDNLAVGVQSGQNNSSSVNTAVGLQVGNNVSSTANVAVGSLGTGSSVSDTSTQTVVFSGVTGNNVAVGGVAGNNVKGALNVGVGWKAGRSVDGFNNVGVGALAGYNTVGNNNIGVGSYASSTVTGHRNVGIGNNAGNTVTGSSNTAIGDNAGDSVNGSSNFAGGLGAGSSVTGSSNIAIGVQAGNGISASNTIAMGTQALASADSTIAIGQGATASGAKSISIGIGNVVSGSSSGAIGDPSTITGSSSYSLGNNNTINANNAFVVGNNVTIPTGLDGAVVLGNNSTVAASTPTPTGTINGTTYNYAGGNPAAGSVVSVGTAGAERQIQNVAAGQVSSTSTDAINGSQLYATNQAIGAVGTQVNNLGSSTASALGGGASYDSTTGAVSAPSYNITGAGGTTNSYNNVGDALTALNQTASAGWDLSAQGTNTTNVAPGASVDLSNTDGNLVVSKSTADNNVTFDLAKNISVDSVTAGNSVLNTNGLSVNDGTNSATYGSTGMAIAGGPSVTISGIDAGGSTITNVAPGVTGTDAANVNQVNAAVSGTTSAGLNFTGNDNSAGDVHRDLGQTLAINGGATTAGTYSGANVKTVTDPTTGAINIQIADAPVFSSVTTGNAVLNTNGLSVNDGTNSATYGSTGMAIAGGPSVTTSGIDAGGSTITNVAPGTNGTDAANMNQLNAVSAAANAGWNLSAQGANTTNVAPGAAVDLSNTDGNLVVSKSTADNNVTFDLAKKISVDSVTAGNSVLNTNGLSVNDGTNSATYGSTGMAIAGGPSVTTTGIDAGGHTITNVGDAVNATDAVNLSQLQAAQAAATTHYYSVNDNGTQQANYDNDGATGVNALAAGVNASAAGASGVALGDGATASADGSIAIGQNAVTNVANSVAIGSGAITSAAVPVASATVGGITYGGFAGSNPIGVFSVGAPGFERQITNVAAGRITADSTDAVNGSQLYQTNVAVGSLSTGLSTTNSAVASLSTSTSTGISSLSTGLADLSTSTSTSISSLSTGLTSLSTSTSTSIGSLSTGLSSTNSSVASLSTTVNGVSNQITELSTTINNNTIRAANTSGIAADMNGTGSDKPSVTAGSNSVAIGANSNDGGRSNVVSVGSDTQQRQITNVAAGTQGTDAVNVNQLNALSTSMSQSLSGQQSQINNLGSALNQTQQALQQTDKMARQGVAAATALTMLPQVEPGKTINVAIGVARYAGQSGMAFGASAHVSTNGILKLGVGVSGDNKTYGVGYGYSW